MNRRHFLLWLGSVGVSAAAGMLLGRPDHLSAAPMARVAPPALPKRPAPPPPALGLVYDQNYQLYQGPRVGTMWEAPIRLQAIVQRLEHGGLHVVSEDVQPASYDQIAAAHAPRYVKYIKNARYLPHEEFAMIRKIEKRLVSKPNASPTPGASPTPPRFEQVIRYVRTPQDAPRYTKLRPYDAAALGAGGAVRAVDMVMSGERKTAFALLRPPGHHATRSRNMGFCVFNNAAVAARHAQKVHGAKRVLILDWDVHHGNGTQEIFYTDPSVLFVSLHQENIYPKRTGKVSEIGAKAGAGYNINIPLPPRTGDAGYMHVLREIVVPVARAFAPDLIVVSAGQDAHAHDFVAQMRVTEGGFGQMANLARALAEEVCDGKLVLVLEGGYNPTAAAKSVEAIVKALNGPPVDLAALPETAGDAGPIASRLAQVRQTHTAYWPVLA